MRTLDMAFFTEILRKHQGNNTLEVTKIEFRPACPVGHNFVSVVQRVDVEGTRMTEGNEEDFTVTLIVKQPLTKLEVLASMPIPDFFNNEKVAYETIVPALKKHTADGTLPFPTYVYADAATTVLEDLSEKAFENVDPAKLLSMEQIDEVIRNMAKIHASSMVLGVKDQAKLDECVNGLTELIFSISSPELQASQIVSMELAIRLFSEIEQTSENIKIREKLVEIKGTICEMQTKLIRDERKHRVINHGDVWKNNIMVCQNEVKFVDLQMMRYTSVASDLSYFLYINMRPKTRHDNMDRFLDIYLTALNKNIEEAGVDMKGELTMQWIKKEMDDFAIVGFISSLWLLPLFCFKSGDLDYKNVTSADFEMETQWGKATTEYKARLEEIVRDYMKQTKVV